ncbi:MAG: P1 family peptidase [Herpetosiphonaceae bacterium]|nr:P1 family peptidase [Herpetosiphonaceae bacterium]
MTEQPLSQGASRPRARDLGIQIGRFEPGPWNAITDVAGVRVGHTTLITGDGPLVVGQGPVRTGVTVIYPHAGNIGTDPVYAGSHVLNGNGEMTGLLWIGEAGKLTTPIGLTNTHSVGVVRDALISYDLQRGSTVQSAWSLPVVAETFDGVLSDINGMHVRPEHVWAALDAASTGPLAEGCVGGGTGMICHGFKGGIGTASRVLPAERGTWKVGVLVQANHGQRHLLRIDGVPVGREIDLQAVPRPMLQAPSGTGSIIVIVATDAPLLPIQCRRLAQRATIGIARTGGVGENSSGDIFLAFSTGNRGLADPPGPDGTLSVRTLPDDALSSLFEAVAEATEEAIINALCAAATMTGINGSTAYELPLDRLQEVMARYGCGTPFGG